MRHKLELREKMRDFFGRVCEKTARDRVLARRADATHRMCSLFRRCRKHFCVRWARDCWIRSAVRWNMRAIMLDYKLMHDRQEAHNLLTEPAVPCKQATSSQQMGENAPPLSPILYDQLPGRQATKKSGGKSRGGKSRRR